MDRDGRNGTFTGATGGGTGASVLAGDELNFWFAGSVSLP